MKVLVVFALFFSLSASCMAASKPLEAQVLDDAIYVNVAREVLKDHRYSQKILDKTSVAVRQFITNMGGDAWYKKYIERWGYPKDASINTSPALIDLNSRTLGLYYIYYAPISAESMRKVCVYADDSKTLTLQALCALSLRNAAMLFNDADSLARFHEKAKWFLDNQKNGKWEWATDFPARDQKAPWISALTQSVIISVLLREYQLGHDKVYLTAATKALTWLRKPEKKGGVSAKMSRGVWYEEYPNTKKPSHILNGHMWALFGIWDYYRVTHDHVAKRMFDDGIEALEHELPKYDVGYWSVYHQTNREAMVTGQYMQFISQQLAVLYALTGIEKFRRVSERWRDDLDHDALFVRNASEEFLKAHPKFLSSIKHQRRHRRHRTMPADTMK